MLGVQIWFFLGQGTKIPHVLVWSKINKLSLTFLKKSIKVETIEYSSPAYTDVRFFVKAKFFNVAYIRQP